MKVFRSRMAYYILRRYCAGSRCRNPDSLPGSPAGGLRPITARLQQASSAAVSALLKVIVDPASPASARVRAADCILDHAKEAIELEDIEARVAELERAAKAEPQARR